MFEAGPGRKLKHCAGPQAYSLSYNVRLYCVGLHKAGLLLLTPVVVTTAKVNVAIAMLCFGLY